MRKALNLTLSLDIVCTRLTFPSATSSPALPISLGSVRDESARLPLVFDGNCTVGAPRVAGCASDYFMFRLRSAALPIQSSPSLHL